MPNLRTLGAHHRLIAVGLASGAKVVDLAEQYGVHHTTISTWRSDPLFAAAEAEAAEELRRRITDATVGEFAELRRLAITALTGILTKEEVFIDDRTQTVYAAPPAAVVQATRVVLDRTDATKKAVELSGEVATVTPDDIAEALARRMRGEE